MNYVLANRQFAMKPQLLYVRFEQGRGKGGVPKTWVPFFEQDGKPPQIETLVRSAVELFRAQCADPYTHGRDLMPGDDDEYHLHNIDGGVINAAEEIKWENIDGAHRAELVLTWGLPSEKLIAEVAQ